ncbi:hypothetical protein BC829DRAFT_417332 [Chytridium lagenaria]|nr:hypothetical protein BC829DRAFT_417332 [Chytridium lagenaria]
MYCPCCDKEMESVTSSRHLEDHLQSTSANGHAIRGLIVTMIMKLDTTEKIYQSLWRFPRHHSATSTKFSNKKTRCEGPLSFANGYGNPKELQRTRFYRLTDVKKKATDVLLTEKVRIAALIDFLPSPSKRAGLQIAPELLDISLTKTIMLFKWADKESEVVVVPDEPRSVASLLRKTSDVKEEYEPTLASIELEIEVVKPKQERLVKAAKIPSQLRIDVEAHVEEEMERTEKPSPTAGKAKVRAQGFCWKSYVANNPIAKVSKAANTSCYVGQERVYRVEKREVEPQKCMLQYA